MEHYLIQYKFFRKIFKGTFYKILPLGLTMGSFWSRTEITSCQSYTLETAVYDIKK